MMDAHAIYLKTIIFKLQTDCVYFSKTLRKMS